MIHHIIMIHDAMQVTLGAVMGVTAPATFDWLTADLFTYCLGFLMLSMGLTLTVDDFKEVML